MRIKYPEYLKKEISGQLFGLWAFTSYQKKYTFMSKDEKVLYTCENVYLFGYRFLNLKIKIRNSILEQEKQVTFVYDLKNNHIDCDSEFSKEYYKEIITDYLNIFVTKTVPCKNINAKKYIMEGMKRSAFFQMKEESYGFLNIRYKVNGSLSNNNKGRRYFYIGRFCSNDIIIAYPKANSNKAFISNVFNSMIYYIKMAGEKNRMDRN